MSTLFGTDGTRARVGTHPFTPNDLIQYGHAIAQWAVGRYGWHARIVLSHDTRHSAHWIKAALQAGMLLHPLSLVYTNTLPTPAVSLLLKQDPELACGIIISASHNPAHDNGIKLVGSNGEKLSADDERAITELFYQSHKPDYTQFGSEQYLHDAQNQYEQLLQDYIPASLSGMKIVLDCAHGATSGLAPRIFEQRGAQVITLGNSPNGININDARGTQHIQAAQQAVVSHRADIGFAFDGDGDRVVAINADGVVKNGDDILALLSTHPVYEHEATLVGTVMSNHALDLYLTKSGKQLVRTPVGDKHVSAYLQAHNLLLGGEQSGHIIMRDYLPTGDGIATALRIAALLKQTGNRRIETFTPCPQRLVNVPVTEKRDLHTGPVADLIHQHEQRLSQGRIVVRYSGTENMLRIMVEDEDTQIVTQIASSLATACKELL